jgi:1,4-alpha-glucan branching enzyme
VVSFLRHADGETLACVVNFSGVPRIGYRIGLPGGGRWEEVVNTDAHVYGGSGVGNFGAVEADGPAADGHARSAEVNVGPYAAVWLRKSG